MPVYDIGCSACREKIREAIVPQFLAFGEEVPGRKCPACGSPMRRITVEVPAHLPGCWSGKHDMRDL